MPGGFCVIPICASVVHSGLSLQGGVYPVVPIRGNLSEVFFFFCVLFYFFSLFFEMFGEFFIGIDVVV